MKTMCCLLGYRTMNLSQLMYLGTWRAMFVVDQATNVKLCIFFPFILNSLLNGYRYQKSRKQKTVRSVSTTSTASEIEFFVIITYSFNYFSRELCLRCYWVPGSAFGPSPAELVISCRTRWTSAYLSTCHFGVSTKFQSFHQLQMTLKFKLWNCSWWWLWNLVETPKWHLL